MQLQARSAAAIVAAASRVSPARAARESVAARRRASRRTARPRSRCIDAARRRRTRRSPTARRALHWAVHHDDVELVERLHRGRRERRTRRTTTAPRRCPKRRSSANAGVIEALLEGRRRRRVAERRRPDGADGRGAHRQRRRRRELLLEPAPTSTRAEQWRGQTALMWAAAQSQPAMVEAAGRSTARTSTRARRSTTGSGR